MFDPSRIRLQLAVLDSETVVCREELIREAMKDNEGRVDEGGFGVEVHSQHCNNVSPHDIVDKSSVAIREDFHKAKNVILVAVCVDSITFTNTCDV